MSSHKNILIVSQAKVTPTETFIRAHLKRIQGNIFHLYGYHLNYFENGISLREKYKPNPSFWRRFLNILPYYIVFRLNQKNQKRLTDFNLVGRYIIENQINVVLAEYGTTGAFITPICETLSIPLIVHFHGNDASRYDLIDRFGDNYRSMFYYSKHVIAVSQRMVNDLITLGCPKDKLVFNPYGPNPKYLESRPNYNSNNIIAIGRQTFKKAPYLSILAFKKALDRNPSLFLHFVGDGEIIEVSKNIVHGLDLHDKVRFHGVKNVDEIIQLINDSFLFMQHSVVAGNGDSEGTPVAILEAMAAGLPVVSTRHAGIQDVVVENTTGLLTEENNIAEMAEHILTLANNRALAKQMGNKGKIRVMKEYTMEKHIQTIQDLINKYT